MGVIIAVVNHKGGVGKSTITANLGAALARRNGRVLVVDCDHQANLTISLLAGARPEPNLCDLLLGSTGHGEPLSPEQIVQATDRVRLDIIPSGEELAEAEDVLDAEYMKERLLAEALGDLPNRYDIIFLDCPPSLGLMTKNALTMATHVLIPVMATEFAAKGVTILSQTIAKVQRRGNPGLQVLGVLVNNYDAHPVVYRIQYQRLVEHLGVLKFATDIPKGVVVEEAHVMGCNVLDYSEGSAVSRAYTALAEEVLTRLEVQ
ncbi:MAG: ParA family protein [Chloroflexi bacterium]|nr:ParA family protein [Chloroflexota bacterium]MBU1746321.1 ParA family protein [Chloroflexota bacterium]